MGSIARYCALDNPNRLTVDKLSVEGCINLLEAFVADVAQEFVTTYKHLLSCPTCQGFIDHYNDLKDYMQSDYFSGITGLNGEEIISTLEYRVRRGDQFSYGQVL